MKFLAIEIEKEGLSTNDFQPYLKDEALKVLELYERGIIREIYFDQNHCAVLMLECSNLNEAKSILNELPLVSKGLIDFNVRALSPYTGFSRLTS